MLLTVYQGRDLESVFEAGPSSSSGQQEGREVSFKGVGTFQVDASDTHRLLRRDRKAETVPFSCIIRAKFAQCTSDADMEIATGEGSQCQAADRKPTLRRCLGSPMMPGRT